MRITYYHRKPEVGQHSHERLFQQIRKTLPDSAEATVAVSRFRSRGLLRRIYNILEAPFRQGDVNHITGDVHFLAYFLRKRKTILTIHDLGHFENLRGIKRRLFALLWLRLPIARSAIITVISQHTRERLLQIVPIEPERFVVIPNCLPDNLQASPYTFNDAKPRILQVGTGPNKNLLLVAQAVEGVPCHLRIIGPLTSSQASLLSSLDIDFSSAASLTDGEVADEYRQCDMVVFASTHEGFGLPIIEAQAVGRPVITSNMTPMSDVAGAGALLVDPYDAQSLHDGILRVIESAATRERLIAAGLANVKRFAPEAIAGLYLRLYKQLANRRPSQ